VVLPAGRLELEREVEAVAAVGDGGEAVDRDLSVGPADVELGCQERAREGALAELDGPLGQVDRRRASGEVTDRVPDGPPVLARCGGQRETGPRDVAVPADEDRTAA